MIPNDLVNNIDALGQYTHSEFSFTTHPSLKSQPAIHKTTVVSGNPEPQGTEQAISSIYLRTNPGMPNSRIVLNPDEHDILGYDLEQAARILALERENETVRHRHPNLLQHTHRARRSEENTRRSS